MRLDLRITDLAGTRFASSPLFETVAALRLLARPGRHDLHDAWLRWARRRVTDRPLALPLARSLLIEPDRQPEFLLPAPAGQSPSIDEEIERVRATTPDQVRTSLARYLTYGMSSPALQRLADAPRDTLHAVTEEIRAAHDLLIAPHWPRMRALLDTDISRRADALADRGAATMFARLHPRLSWRDGQLMVRQPARPTGTHRVATLGTGGLVLVPSVFLWPDLWVKQYTVTQTTIRYPASAAATVWQAGSPRRGTATADRLLGRSRSRLLSRLGSPATTGDLAAALGVTPSAVSQQLALLRAASLVRSERHGRTVRHMVTPLGRTLLDALGAGRPGAATTSSLDTRG